MCQSSALHASGALLTLFLSQNCFCMRGLTILCSAFLFGINPLSQILSQNYLPKMSVLCPVDSTFTWSLRMSRSGHISVLYFFKLNTISSNSLIQLWFSEENVMYSFYGRCCHFPLIDVFVFVFCFFFWTPLLFHEAYAGIYDGISTQGWFIGLMCAVALLTLLLLTICFVRRNKGGKYSGKLIYCPSAMFAC